MNVEWSKQDWLGFEFFQTVRFIDNQLHEFNAHCDTEGKDEKRSVFHYLDAGSEFVFINASHDLGFSQFDVTGLYSTGEKCTNLNGVEKPNYADAFRYSVQLDTDVAGVHGSHSILPQYYSQKINEQDRLGNQGYGAFFKMLEHRSLSLLYQTERKRKPHLMAEPSTSVLGGQPDENKFLSTLLALAGVPDIKRSDGNEQAFIASFVGGLSMSNRPASYLQAMLSYVLGQNVKIEEMTGGYQNLEDTYLSQLSEGQNNQLGGSAMLGHSSFLPQAHFSIIIGPIDYHSYMQIIRDSRLRNNVEQIIKYFKPLELDFSLFFELIEQDIPNAYLEGMNMQGTQLGVNSNLGHSAIAPENIVRLVSEIW